jgi:methionine sulfoxide reductase heme-binding subunit
LSASDAIFPWSTSQANFVAGEHDYKLFSCYYVGAMIKKLLGYPFQIVTFLAIASLAWAIFTYGQSVEASQAITRFTARISLFIFALVFSASSLHKLLRNDFTAELLRNRRGFGVSFAFSHTIHLLALIIFFRLSNNEVPKLTLIFGGLAYFLTYAMAVTSNDWSVRKLGAKNWKLLHKIGIFYIWLIFFITYLRRILPAKAGEPGPGGTKTEFIVGFIIILALLCLRIAAAISARTGRQIKLAAKSEVLP